MQSFHLVCITVILFTIELTRCTSPLLVEPHRETEPPTQDYVNNTRASREIRKRPGGKNALFNRVPGDFEGTIAITAAPCQSEGVVLIQGHANYYMRCVRNEETSGFFQQVNICPKNINSISEASKCFPPPDCSQCAVAKPYCPSSKHENLLAQQQGLSQHQESLSQALRQQQASLYQQQELFQQHQSLYQQILSLTKQQEELFKKQESYEKISRQALSQQQIQTLTREQQLIFLQQVSLSQKLITVSQKQQILLQKQESFLSEQQLSLSKLQQTTQNVVTGTQKISVTQQQAQTHLTEAQKKLLELSTQQQYSKAGQQQEYQQRQAIQNHVQVAQQLGQNNQQSGHLQIQQGQQNMLQRQQQASLLNQHGRQNVLQNQQQQQVLHDQHATQFGRQALGQVQIHQQDLIGHQQALVGQSQQQITHGLQQGVQQSLVTGRQQQAGISIQLASLGKQQAAAQSQKGQLSTGHQQVGLQQNLQHITTQNQIQRQQQNQHQNVLQGQLAQKQHAQQLGIQATEQALHNQVHQGLQQQGSIAQQQLGLIARQQHGSNAQQQVGSIAQQQQGSIGQQVGSIGQQQHGSIGQQQHGLIGQQQVGSIGQQQHGSIGQQQVGSIGQQQHGSIGQHQQDSIAQQQLLAQIGQTQRQIYIDHQQGIQNQIFAKGQLQQAGAVHQQADLQQGLHHQTKQNQLTQQQLQQQHNQQIAQQQNQQGRQSALQGQLAQSQQTDQLGRQAEQVLHNRVQQGLYQKGSIAQQQALIGQSQNLQRQQIVNGLQGGQHQGLVGQLQQAGISEHARSLGGQQALVQSQIRQQGTAHQVAGHTGNLQHQIAQTHLHNQRQQQQQINQQQLQQQQLHQNQQLGVQSSLQGKLVSHDQLTNEFGRQVVEQLGHERFQQEANQQASIAQQKQAQIDQSKNLQHQHQITNGLQRGIQHQHVLKNQQQAGVSHTLAGQSQQQLFAQNYNGQRRSALQEAGLQQSLQHQTQQVKKGLNQQSSLAQHQQALFGQNLGQQQQIAHGLNQEVQHQILVKNQLQQLDASNQLTSLGKQTGQQVAAHQQGGMKKSLQHQKIQNQQQAQQGLNQQSSLAQHQQSIFGQTQLKQQQQNAQGIRQGTQHQSLVNAQQQSGYKQLANLQEQQAIAQSQSRVQGTSHQAGLQQSQHHQITPDQLQTQQHQRNQLQAQSGNRLVQQQQLSQGQQAAKQSLIQVQGQSLTQSSHGNANLAAHLSAAQSLLSGQAAGSRSLNKETSTALIERQQRVLQQNHQGSHSALLGQQTRHDQNGNQFGSHANEALHHQLQQGQQEASIAQQQQALTANQIGRLNQRQNVLQKQKQQQALQDQHATQFLTKQGSIGQQQGMIGQSQNFKQQIAHGIQQGVQQSLSLGHQQRAAISDQLASLGKQQAAAQIQKGQLSTGHQQVGLQQNLQHITTQNQIQRQQQNQHQNVLQGQLAQNQYASQLGRHVVGQTVQHVQQGSLAQQQAVKGQQQIAGISNQARSLGGQQALVQSQIAQHGMAHQQVGQQISNQHLATQNNIQAQKQLQQHQSNQLQTKSGNSLASQQQQLSQGKQLAQQNLAQVQGQSLAQSGQVDANLVAHLSDAQSLSSGQAAGSRNLSTATTSGSNLVNRLDTIQSGQSLATSNGALSQLEESSTNSGTFTSDTISVSSFFSSLTIYIRTLKFDVFTSSITSTFDYSGDTAFEDFKSVAAVALADIMKVGTIANIPNLLPSTGCPHVGTFPTPDRSIYMECVRAPAGNFHPQLRDCGANYLFSLRISRCVHQGAVPVLKDDLGIHVGPSSKQPFTVPGVPSPLSFVEFPGIPNNCQAPGQFPFGHENRYYLQCHQAGAPGALHRCPSGYYFDHRRLKCISGNDLQTKPDEPHGNMPGIIVTRASPLFILPECSSVGVYPYPDYRFYYTCELPSKSAVLVMKIYQCQVGLFYNPVYHSCAKASAFMGRDYEFSWAGIHTHWAVSRQMDLRSGISVSVGSVPYQFPASDQIGKFPLPDLRYYYFTQRTPQGLAFQLYICHSGFYFSPRAGYCVPTFIHESVIAASSYRYGVDLAREVNLVLHQPQILQIGEHSKELLARPHIGLPAVVANPALVFGSQIDKSSLYLELAPCNAAGFYSTPDYRFYYTCMVKSSPLGIEEDDSSENEVDNNLDDDNIYEQILYQCPTGLFYSDSVGFCVAAYFHNTLSMVGADKYLWEHHQFLSSVSVTSDGLLCPEEATPWITNVCRGDGKFPLRDPRYYVHCHGTHRGIKLCPANTYFNAQTGNCVQITNCNCWREAGLPFDPAARANEVSNIPGVLGQDFQIILDRSYHRLLRRVAPTLVKRATHNGLGDGLDAGLIARLLCFWREMEKQRTLKYPSKIPPNKSSLVPLGRNFR